jgi:hypothetical protein
MYWYIKNVKWMKDADGHYYEKYIWLPSSSALAILKKIKKYFLVIKKSEK